MCLQPRLMLILNTVDQAFLKIVLSHERCHGAQIMRLIPNGNQAGDVQCATTVAMADGERTRRPGSAFHKPEIEAQANEGLMRYLVRTYNVQPPIAASHIRGLRTGSPIYSRGAFARCVPGSNSAALPASPNGARRVSIHRSRLIAPLLHRYRAFKRGKVDERSDNIHTLADQLGLTVTARPVTMCG